MVVAEEKAFSELQLGIRELFRIVIPGAYAVVLVGLIAPETHFFEQLTSSTARLLGVTFFLGLVGYALRPNDCWWPYFVGFDGGINKLNAEIAKAAGRSPEDEYTAEYKYFLTTGPPEVRD